MNSVSPVKQNVSENIPVDNSELVKSIQSLRGKVEGLKNELKQSNARISKLEAEKLLGNKVVSTNAIGQELITETV